MLGNEPYTIVGVIGKSFVTDPPADLWLPFQFDPNSNDRATTFLVAGRLKPGVTLAQANAQMKVAADQFRRRIPERSRSERELRGPAAPRCHRQRRALLAARSCSGAVGLVLLIACANVANLLLVRATGRKREFAIRSAMGAGRARIVRQLLTESVLLAVAGGVLGLDPRLRWRARSARPQPRQTFPASASMAPPSASTGAFLSSPSAYLVFTGILFGLFPAIGASRPDLNSTLKESSNRSGTGFRQSKGRSLLVISEVSLALVLLIGAALLIRTYIALRDVNPGFDPHHVLTMEMSLTGDKYQKTAGVALLVRNARERLNAIPGVEASASSCCIPLQGGFGLPFNIVGRPTGKSPYTGGAGWMSVSPGYFSVFKIPTASGPRLQRHRTPPGPPESSSSIKRWPNSTGPRAAPSASRSSSAKASALSLKSPPARSSASSETSTTAASTATRARS